MSASIAVAGAGERVAPATEPFRTERTIGLIRVAVVAVVTAVYLSSLGIERSLGSLAVSILALSAVYALWVVLARPYESEIGMRFRAASLLADFALISLWTQATGGPESEFWTLYLIVVIAVALRFDLIETLGAALAMALVYVSMMSVLGGLPVSSLLARPSLMVITGFAVGVLAEQRRSHEQERTALERLAEERFRALEEEQAVVAKLRELDIAKTEFVAVASHEFRTPLSAIVGVLGTLRRHGDVLEPEVRDELLDGAEAQATRLGRLVEDLLTVSRIEAGSLPLDVQPVHPERLILEAGRASRTSDVLKVELNGVDRVACDADKIVRVLSNLLDNARKYSPPGAPIALSVEEEAQVVRFRISDTGPGVPHEQRERIFDRFRRLVDGREQPGGAGLGLYISRCLVEAHGGSIRVDEAEAGGAEFVFELPVPGAAARPPAVAGRRV
jgi:signal transduction histidine kinase